MLKLLCFHAIFKVQPRCSSASVHRFRSRTLFSFFLSFHAYTKTNDLLCPLILFFCLKLWVINLPSQHLQELRGRRRKPWWTQFLPTAKYQILSPAQLTSSLLTHSNLRMQMDIFVWGNFIQIQLIWTEENNFHYTDAVTFVLTYKVVVLHLTVCTYVFYIPESSLPPPFWRLWLLLLLGPRSVDIQISKEALRCHNCGNFSKLHRK